MSKRLNISSGAKWEDSVGYSRAVRVGGLIEVAGTTAVDENGQVIGMDDPYEQTRFILSKIEKAIKAAGGRINDVVRTRIFVTDITHWEAIGKAHGEYFRNIKPAATMVEVRALISPELLVEIEATAMVKKEDEMKFKMSPNIAVRHQDYKGAVEFYTDVLGFENRSSDPDLADFDADPINLFVIEDDEFSGPVLELFVSDLEEARAYLVENGCTVLRWRGKGQDCYIQDPYGVRYNIWEI